MAISVGDTLPDAQFKSSGPDGFIELSTSDVFKGKKVVLFAVPGAFTPTCSMNHLPGYLENRDAIKARGVDEIAVVAVNDPHVMKAWADATGAKDKILFLSDGNADFAKAIGMDIDLSGGGLGTRSKRYAMLVDDGKVQVLNVEDSPGKAVESGAAKMLESL